MKISIQIILYIILLSSCNKKPTTTNPITPEKFNCIKGKMQMGVYTMGQDEIFPYDIPLDNSFTILVDTALKAKNFISFHESFERKEAQTLDTFDLQWRTNWLQLNKSQKLNLVKKRKQQALQFADSLHHANNTEQQQIWIINNSKDTVSLQMQDWLYFCILEAKSKQGQWHPIEYCPSSSCGNSYYFKYFPPKTSNSFVTQLPNRGNYKTKLRYKLLGDKTFYYSNEFEGSINYCEFVESDSLDYSPYKLERLRRFAWKRFN